MKDIRARPLRTGRTEPLLDLDLDDPALLGAAVVVVLTIVLVAAKVIGWI